MIQFLLFLVLNTITFISFHYFCTYIFHSKKQLQTYQKYDLIFHYIIAITLSTFVRNMFDDAFIIYSSLLILCYFIVDRGLYSSQKKLTVSLSFILVSFSSHLVYILWFKIPFYKDIPFTDMMFMRLFSLLIIFIMISTQNRIKEIMISRLQWVGLVLSPLWLISLLLCLFGDPIIENKTLALIIIFNSSFFALNLFITIRKEFSDLLKVKCRQLIIENELYIIQQQKEFYEKEILSIKNNQEDILKLHHDQINHMILLKTLCHDQRYVELKTYIDELIIQSDDIINETHSGHYIIDSILNHFIYICHTHNIEIDVQTLLPSNLELNFVDMNIILSNLLSNAIEATLKVSQNKRIELNMRYFPHYIILSITNPYARPIDKVGTTIKTTKEEKYHGYGLKSIQDTVNKYDGSLDYHYNKTHFTSTVFIYL